MTKCHPCRLLALGDCCAIRRHSSITSRSTGRVKSIRLRTERVVDSTSSAESDNVAMSYLTPTPLHSQEGNDIGFSGPSTVVRAYTSHTYPRAAFVASRSAAQTALRLRMSAA